MCMCVHVKEPYKVRRRDIKGQSPQERVLEDEIDRTDRWRVSPPTGRPDIGVMETSKEIDERHGRGMASGMAPSKSS